MRDQAEIEEILERLWTAEEDGIDMSVDRLVREGFERPDRLLGSLMEQAMVALRDDRVVLSDTGRDHARRIIRQHRLAECLFREVLLLDEENAEASACHFEHLLNPAVVGSICTFLGHPARCPHGKEIPRGECCSRYSLEVKPLVGRLSDAAVGQTCRIVFLHSRSGASLERLSALGLNPGSTVRVRQKYPSFVLEAGESLLAVETAVADTIYVKPNGADAPAPSAPATARRGFFRRWLG